MSRRPRLILPATVVVVFVAGITTGCSVNVSEAPETAEEERMAALLLDRPPPQVQPVPPTLVGQRVRVHFRRDLLGVEGPVGLDVPERSLDTFSVVGELVERGDAWLTLRDEAGREVLIPTSSVMAIVLEETSP